MNEQNVKQNSLKAWILAARPKTLTGAMVPVMIGLALAVADMGMPINIIPAVLCILFAIIMQINANFVNDYFDWRKGNDKAETRLGPLRACSMGWITPNAMTAGIIATTITAGAIGLPLIYYGGWQMLIIGLLCIIFCILYTTTMSYIGLGDLLVLVFFGIVPVGVTYYIQLGTINLWIVIISAACGLVIDNLLIVNNYRDIDNDRQNGKRTLIVILGRNVGQAMYFIFGLAATIAVAAYTDFDWRSLIMLLYLLPHCKTYQQLGRLNGKELNKVLGKTARNNLLFGIATSIIILL